MKKLWKDYKVITITAIITLVVGQAGNVLIGIKDWFALPKENSKAIETLVTNDKKAMIIDSTQTAKIDTIISNQDKYLTEKEFKSASKELGVWLKNELDRKLSKEEFDRINDLTKADMGCDSDTVLVEYLINGAIENVNNKN